MAGNQPTRLNYDSKDESFFKNNPVLETFLSAAETFVKHEDETVKIWAASRDWFMEEWGRDTFISLPGILLVPKRFDEAKEVFRNFANHRKGGIIPNRIQKGRPTEYNTIDASMWYIQALKSYLEYTKDLRFVLEMLPILTEVLDAYRKGTSYERFGHEHKIRMDNKPCPVDMDGCRPFRKWLINCDSPKW
jgi:predicted glycogen debranching enzyme